MLVLLLHHVSLDEFCSLHLEREHLGHLVDPRRLVGLVPLAVGIVLVVRHLRAEHVLPRLVKVRLVLNIQDDVVLDGGLCSALRQLLFVHKLDKIFNTAVEHLAESVTIFLQLFRVINLHHLIEAGSTSGTTRRLSPVALSAKIVSSP